MVDSPPTFPDSGWGEWDVRIQKQNPVLSTNHINEVC